MQTEPQPGRKERPGIVLQAPVAYLDLLQAWKKQAAAPVAFDYATLLQENPAHAAVLNQGPCVTWILDLRTAEFSFIGDNTPKLLGYPATSFRQQGLAFLNQIIHPDDLEKTWALFKQVLDFLNARPAEKRKDYKFNRDYRITRPDGTQIRILEQSSVLQQDSTGNITHIMGIYSDISRLKKSEALRAAITSSITSRTQYFYASGNTENPVFANWTNRSWRIQN